MPHPAQPVLNLYNGIEVLDGVDGNARRIVRREATEPRLTPANLTVRDAGGGLVLELSISYNIEKSYSESSKPVDQVVTRDRADASLVLTFSRSVLTDQSST